MLNTIYTINIILNIMQNFLSYSTLAISLFFTFFSIPSEISYENFIRNLTGENPILHCDISEKDHSLITDTPSIVFSQIFLALEKIYNKAGLSFSIYDKNALGAAIYTTKLDSHKRVEKYKNFLNNHVHQKSLADVFSYDMFSTVRFESSYLYNNDFILSFSELTRYFGIPQSLFIQKVSNFIPFNIRENTLLKPIIHTGATVILPIWLTVKKMLKSQSFFDMPLSLQYMYHFFKQKKYQKDNICTQLNLLHTLVTTYESYTKSVVEDPDILRLKKRGKRNNIFLQYLCISTDITLLRRLKGNADLLEKMLITLSELKPCFALQKLNQELKIAPVEWRTDNPTFSFDGESLLAPDTLFNNNAVPLTIDLTDNMVLFSANGSGKSCLYRTITFNYLLALLSGYVIGNKCTITPGYLIIKGAPIKKGVHLDHEARHNDLTIEQDKKYLLILDEPAGEKSGRDAGRYIEELLRAIKSQNNTRILCATHSKHLRDICRDQHKYQEFFFETSVRDNEVHYTRKLISGSCPTWQEPTRHNFLMSFIKHNNKQDVMSIDSCRAFNYLRSFSWDKTNHTRFAADELCSILQNGVNSNIQCHNITPNAISVLDEGIKILNEKAQKRQSIIDQYISKDTQNLMNSPAGQGVYLFNSLMKKINKKHVDISVDQLFGDTIPKDTETEWLNHKMVDTIAEKYAYLHAQKARFSSIGKWRNETKELLFNSINGYNDLFLKGYEGTSEEIHFNILLPQVLRGLHFNRYNAQSEKLSIATSLALDLLYRYRQGGLASLVSFSACQNIILLFSTYFTGYLQAYSHLDNKFEAPPFFYFDQLAGLFNTYIVKERLDNILPEQEKAVLAQTIKTIEKWKKIRKFFIMPTYFIMNPLYLGKATEFVNSSDCKECIKNMAHFLLIRRGLKLAKKRPELLYISCKELLYNITITNRHDLFEKYVIYTMKNKAFWALYPYCDEEPENNLSRGTKEAQVYNEIMAALELCKAEDREIVIYLDNFGMGTQHELQKEYLVNIINAVAQHNKVKLCIVTFNTELENELNTYIKDLKRII